MSLMSLRESLARSKAKWKKRLHKDTGNANTVPLTSQGSGPISTHPSLTSSPFPTGPSSNPSTPSVNQQSSSTPKINNQSGKGNIVWEGAKTLLTALESSSDAFGPLQSAVSGLAKCVDIYERAGQGRKDYDELKVKLDGLLADLAQHVTHPMDPMMTNSVKLLCSNIEAELKGMEDNQARKFGQRLADAMDSQDEIIERYRRIHDYLERLMLNANLSMLNANWNIQKAINEQTTELRLKWMVPALSAIYHSAESDIVKRGGCAPGTREPQINLLLEWARDSDAGRTCWMNGMAGTGKTTIAYTVCGELDGAFELGASFFCSRAISECRQVKHIIPSISYQLARFSLPFRCALDKVLGLDPDAHTRALRIQHQKLIVEPLMEVQRSLPTDFIVVIDALDECEDESSLGQILDLLLSSKQSLPIRFLVSSRPETEIYERLAGNTRLVLHELDSVIVKADVEAYMRQELQNVPLTDVQWSGLLERCGVLFIYASTTCRLIQQGHRMKTLDEAVDTVLSPVTMPTQRSSKNVIDELYSTILISAFDESRMSPENRVRMRNVLETVICAQEPMSLGALSGILRLKSSDQVEALLQPLRSVLNITISTGVVTTLHASFLDFMLTFNRSTIFHCSPDIRHMVLAESCLQMIDGAEPKFNICGLPSSYLPDEKVENLGKLVKQKISPGLLYACRYWSIHLSLGNFNDKTVDFVRNFFLARLFIWMEVLNLTKNMRFGTSASQVAEKWCREKGIPEDLVRIARDAGQFVSIYANHPISQSTPHIYVSMLPFWPRSRPVSIAYAPRTIKVPEPTGSSIAQRQPVLLATWKVSSGIVYSISLSADGNRIAAAANHAVELLDTSTGDGILQIKGTQAEDVQAVSISPDGTQIAFGRYGGSVYVSEIRQGSSTELFTRDIPMATVVFSPNGTHIAYSSLDGPAYICAPHQEDLVLELPREHVNQVNSIAFSPDGRFIASGSNNKTIQIWDAKSGQKIGRPLEGHTSWVRSVSYSPDGSRLVSGSTDETIRVWDPLTGKTVLGPLKEHFDRVYTVAFSPDGCLIASGSADNTIRVYDAETGHTVVGPLEAHTDFVNSVIFSPDSTRLYSCSDDGTIRLWSVLRDAPITSQPTTLPNDFRTFRYSPDGLRVVSASSDCNVCAWDVQTGESVLGPLPGHSDAIVLVDFSPDGAYIASASEDCTLIVWSAQDGKDLHGPIKGHAQGVQCVRFSPDSSLVASGSIDRKVKIWEVANARPVFQSLDGHSSGVYSIAFSPDGLRLVSGTYDGTIRVWDLKTGQTVLGPLKGHEKRVTSVEYSPDGSRILSGSWGGSIRVWDALTGQAHLVFGKGPNDIDSVAYSPDGLLIASGSDDKTIRVWDAETGDLILVLEGHVNWARSVQFSPDGSRVASCSDDGTIRFWDILNRRAARQLNIPGDTPVDSTTDPWSLNEDGWVVDKQQNQLVWVPDDLRICLLRHSNDSIICKRGSLKLDLEGTNIGEQWKECYQSK
ncbi:unnamed protein product [Rhizoctonia solani]|nr:unnamed protein product [Rhizoctonia solani]